MAARNDRTSRNKRRGYGGGRGFTLLETALATVIIGVGILALIEAQAAFSRHNDFSSSSATGAYLCNELRERMRGLPRHDPVAGLYFASSNGQAATLRGWGREEGETTPGDFNDTDDFDGLTFGAGGDFPGPINSRSDVLSEIGRDGQPLPGAEGQPVSMRGWWQVVTVDKVDPQNFATVRAESYVRPAVPPDFAGLDVHQFPLRVTVTVFYQGPTDTERQQVARLVWIAP